MSTHTLNRWLAGAALFGAATSLACEDETVVLTEAAQNRPPTIVRTGPDFSAEPVEAGPNTGPSLFALVADPDGLDDIAAVFLDIDSIRVNAVVARPDTTRFGCFTPRYVAGDTIDIRQFINPRLPERSELMTVTEGSGVYRSRSLSPPSVIVASDSEAFDLTFPGCLTGSWMEFFTILAPAVPEDELAFTTLEDVTYFGIVVTVHDAAGSSASDTFPDLRIVYTTDEEKRIAP